MRENQPGGKAESFGAMHQVLVIQSLIEAYILLRVKGIYKNV